jgi:tetratricopeptide (TPR) repeat protein
MKHIFMVAAVFVLAVACNRAILPAATPVINTEITNESGQTILAGRGSIAAMQLPNYKAWYDDSYNKYTVDTVTVKQLKPLLQNKRMEIFLGTWCGDSRREVPRMLKILQQVGMDTTKLALIFVDNSTDKYKQSPQREEKDKNIHHVPSFILYDEKKEIGRIVESPLLSLEKDMLAILRQQPYQPHYRAIEYWRKYIADRKENMTDEALQNQVAILKPLCRHYGEFNAYAYVLLAAKDHTEALNAFRLNTMIYPDNPHVFESLGEAYEKVGNKKGAIAAYEKVLMLNPIDENTKKKVTALKM